MEIASIYKISTGEIKRIVTGTRSGVIAQIQAGESISFGYADSNTQYVQQSGYVDRPVQQITLSKTSLAADGVDLITISRAVDGSQLTAVNMQTGETVTGAISNNDEFYTNMPGDIKITISLWPYQDYEVTINAY